MSTRPVDHLELVKGSARRIEIEIVDDRGNPESLADVDVASVTIRDGESGPVILQLDTVEGDLAVDVGKGLLVGTPSQLKADALVVGAFVGAFAVHFQSIDTWVDGDEFNTFVKPSIAARP